MASGLECPTCLQEYGAPLEQGGTRRPFVLLCLHTFCKECVLRATEKFKTTGNLKKSVLCPKCRKKSSIKRCGWNFDMEGLVETTKEIQTTKEEACRQADELRAQHHPVAIVQYQNQGFVKGWNTQQELANKEIVQLESKNHAAINRMDSTKRQVLQLLGLIVSTIIDPETQRDEDLPTMKGRLSNFVGKIASTLVSAPISNDSSIAKNKDKSLLMKDSGPSTSTWPLPTNNGQPVREDPSNKYKAVVDKEPSTSTWPFPTNSTKRVCEAKVDSSPSDRPIAGNSPKGSCSQTSGTSDTSTHEAHTSAKRPRTDAESMAAPIAMPFSSGSGDGILHEQCYVRQSASTSTPTGSQRRVIWRNGRWERTSIRISSVLADGKIFPPVVTIKDEDYEEVGKEVNAQQQAGDGSIADGI